MLTLEDAIVFATTAHKGQKDLSGAPYILHPLTVMSKMETDTERIIAVLHDTTEDTKATLDDITDLGATEEIVRALWLLDKHNYEGTKQIRYSNMIVNIRKNLMAKKVKIADLEHNMDLRRIIGREKLEQKDKDRIEKYLWAWTLLKGE